MVFLRDRFVQNGKEMFRNKKKHVKGVQGFCFRHLLCKTCGLVTAVCRVVGLKLPFFFRTGRRCFARRFGPFL